ncbi:MAG TPA: hypothetical protein VFQ48_11425, partial [Pseudonocardiaceae bacterium]|nr:hypothetical protein [Pseudonocardiaceae bacterium]
SWLVQVDVRDGSGRDQWLHAGRLLERTAVLAAAHRLTGSPAAAHATERPGWRLADCTLWGVA